MRVKKSFLSSAKLGTKGLIARGGKQIALQQNIARPTFLPVYDQPRPVAWTVVKFSPHKPPGRLFVKVRLDRSEGPVRSVFVTGGK